MTRYTFTLQDLFIAIGCFAVALTIIRYCLTREPSYDIGDVRWLFMLFLSPGIGLSVGLGIGVLLHQKLICSLIGFFVPATVVLLLVLSAH